MNCHQTPDMVADYFNPQLTPSARQAMTAHLAQCPRCRQELAALAPVGETLHSWREEPVPDWDRSAVVPPASARLPSQRRRGERPGQSSWRSTARWIPLAASLVLAVAVFTQTRLQVSEQGWTLSFGAPQLEEGLQAHMEETLAAYARSQHQQTEQMLTSALQAYGDETADSLGQLINWFEQQREQDMQRLEAGFQQMLDRDYQTVNSMQQLASFVQYQGDLP